ncbi:hypothetical protein CPB84DRAFT_1849340 [Gymnopilus junonius]|uniref:F-box domain-containing protein n=1 Tax=Gymnopilus junonius TaxID=109634 RepID=A0A9P5NI23_GYMJU|nr:hypothetical protein CPB84DRAFT_1849340 [Gymnopilus junonius]
MTAVPLLSSSATAASSWTLLNTSSSSSTSLTLLTLPPEILLHIFLNLTDNPSSLFALQLTCSFLNTLISGSSELHYQAALIATHQDNNAKSSLPVKEKLDRMQESSRRWSILDLDEDSEAEGEGEEKSRGKGKETLKDGNKRMRQIKAGHEPSGIYDLTGGVYVLGDFPRKVLHWVKLPGQEEIQDGIDPKWNKIDLDVLKTRADSDRRERTIVDMGLCIYEHDLVAIVTLSPQRTPDGAQPTENDIDLVLLQFSTGLPHPALAASQGTSNRYIRRVMSSPVGWQPPAVGIEIVGEHLVLVLHYHSASTEDRVYVWEWKTGVLKMSLTAPYQTYSGLIFLTPSLIALPNAKINTLDVFHIPSKPSFTPARPILRLSLPALAGGRTLAGISCRAEPNPVGGTSTPQNSSSSSTAAASSSFSSGAAAFATTSAAESAPISLTPTRPFLPSAEHAICVFSIRMSGIGLPLLNLHFGHTFTFLVHRSALVDIVRREAPFHECEGDEKAEERQQQEQDGTNTAAAAEIAGRGNEENPMDDEPATPSSAFASSCLHDPIAGHHTKVIPYTLWGPPITRWFNSDSISTGWITTTCGQRLVLTADGDFCEANVRRMGKRLKSVWEVERERRQKEAQRHKGKGKELVEETLSDQHQAFPSRYTGVELEQEHDSRSPLSSTSTDFDLGLEFAGVDPGSFYGQDFAPEFVDFYSPELGSYGGTHSGAAFLGPDDDDDLYEEEYDEDDYMLDYEEEDYDDYEEEDYDDYEEDDEDDEDGESGVGLYSTDTDAQTRTRPGAPTIGMARAARPLRVARAARLRVRPGLADRMDVDDFDTSSGSSSPSSTSNVNAERERGQASTSQPLSASSAPALAPDSDVVDASAAAEPSPPHAPALPLHRLWHVTSSQPLEPTDAFAEPVIGGYPMSPVQVSRGIGLKGY